MGREASEFVRPVLRDADGLPVEVGTWRSIKRPGEPITEEKNSEGCQLPARAAVREEPCERIAEADLGEGIFEREVGLRVGSEAEKDAERDEQKASPESVEYLARKILAPLGAACDRVWQRSTDEEGEAGLDGVVQAHS